ncbi:MAG: PAS domain S-box protein [Kiritimatiellae bacterium]|nr:PAS domain S-box protein [Kiritimatiellia bacterium]
MDSAKKASTMRIDLIPEISDGPLSIHPRSVSIRMPGSTGLVPPGAAPGSTGKIAATPAAAAAGVSAPPGGGYGELFQNIYDAAIVTDLHGRVRDANRRAASAFGYTNVQFSHMTIDQLVAGADGDLVRTLYENLRRECFTLLQASCVRADGSVFPAEVSVSQLRLSTPHLCFFVRDETVRRQTDEMLRTEHNAIQNASDAIVVVDPQARIEYANPATARIWGRLSAGDLVGRPLGILLQNPDDANEIIASLAGENFDAAGVAVAKRANGEVFRVEIRASCNRDSAGNAVGAVISFSDMTEKDRVTVAEHDAEIVRGAMTRLETLHQAMRNGMDEIAAFFSSFAESAASPEAVLGAKGTIAGIQSICADADELFASVLHANG